MRPRPTRWLAGRYAPAVVIALGIALASPALTVSFAADDHMHRLFARDDPGVDGFRTRPLDLFVFASGVPDEVTALRDEGVFPWWVHPGARLAFMRPVSSLTHAVDQALWPDEPALHAAHSLAWLAVMLAMAWLLYRRFIDARWVAVLALLLYAVDDARGPVVGWIANRNAMIAVTLAIPVLIAHDAWRRGGWRMGRWLAPVLLIPALLAGESALAITAYLAAHALHIDTGTIKQRVLALAPYAVVVVGWRLVYAGLGYGVEGSGIYVDPVGQPLLFAEMASQRMPLLLLGQFALPWSDLSSLYPLIGADVHLFMVVSAAVTVLGLAVLAWPLLRIDRVSRFFATGMLLAAVPICSTFAADRLLGFVGIGAMGLMARFLAAAVQQRSLLGASRTRRIAAIAAAAVLALINLGLAPPGLLLRSRAMVDLGALLERGEIGIPRDAGVVDKTVVAVSTPADPWGGYVPVIRASRDQPKPAHLYWLAVGSSPIAIERVDRHTLRITVERGWLEREMDLMLRNPREHPFAAGDRVRLPGLDIEVEAVTDDARPHTVRARFDQPLDDPSLVFVRWDADVDHYVPYAPPAIGERHHLPTIDFLELVTEPR